MANNYNDDDDIITLQGANGEEIDFTEVAGINYRGKYYMILQPVELLDDMEADEALVFRVTRGKDGEDKYDIELDDKIIDAVFAEYNRLLDEQEGKTSSRNVSRTQQRGGKGNSGGKKQKKSRVFLPLLFTVILFVVSMVGLALEWNDTIVMLAFLASSACLVWFIVGLVLHFLKKLRK